MSNTIQKQLLFFIAILTLLTVCFGHSVMLWDTKALPYLTIICLLSVVHFPRRSIYYIAFFSTLLTLFGYFFSPTTNNIEWLEIFNRTLAIISIWLTARFALHRNDLEKKFTKNSEIIISAQKEERKRISREIHDDLGQNLATLKLSVQTFFQKYSTHSEDFDKESSDIINQINNTIESSRQFSYRIRTSTLSLSELQPAIEEVINQTSRHGLDIEFKHQAINQIQLQSDPINLFRIIQEALTNIIKHAQSSKVLIEILNNGKTIKTIIKDNGVGLEKEIIDRKSSGLGFTSMRERAKLLGGVIKLKSKKGKGTQVELVIPNLSRKGVLQDETTSHISR